MGRNNIAQSQEETKGWDGTVSGEVLFVFRPFISFPRVGMLGCDAMRCGAMHRPNRGWGCQGDWLNGRLLNWKDTVYGDLSTPQGI